MKTNCNHLLLGLTILLVFSCNNSTLDYKYSDREDTMICPSKDVNIPLLKDALYSFEENLTELYPVELTNIARGYTSYLSVGISGRIPETTKILEHTRAVIKELKKEKDLWIVKDGKYSLNYNHPTVTCIGNNIQNKDLKTTFKALSSTNSMNTKLFGTPLRARINSVTNDKFLATFIALDMFYARLMDVDFQKVELPKNNETTKKIQPQA